VDAFEVAADRELLERIRRLTGNPDEVVAGALPGPAVLASSVELPQGKALPQAQAAVTKPFSSVVITPSSALLLQRLQHSPRYETSFVLQQRNAEYAEVNLAVSTGFLKLSRTRVILANDNVERYAYHVVKCSQCVVVYLLILLLL
jgi:hypothetical protein